VTPGAVRAHRGRALPLRRRDVDTDQIIPAEFCKRITRTGYEDTLFHRWRQDPGFVLNDPAFHGASVLVAGPDFGIGSSREHAVWALRDYGFRALLAPSFGDIFRVNTAKNGIITAAVGETIVTRLWDLIEAAPDTMIDVDLERCLVTAGDEQTPFAIDAYGRWQLMNGLDDIEVTLNRSAAIASYELTRHPWLPSVAG
jgi:3-isopropylmalate/(R)-2-methylmalate dehydratase small subunit